MRRGCCRRRRQRPFHRHLAFDVSGSVRRGSLLPRVHGAGNLEAVTLGGCGIWAFVDLFLIILKKLPDAQGLPLRYASPSQPSDKDWGSALLLSIFLGWLGIDRFYLGYNGLGVVKLVTGGACGIWCLVDTILIAVNKLPDSNGKLLRM